MLHIERQLEELRQWLEAAHDNVLSIYADVHPGKPENAGRAWRLRIKNALKELPEIRDRAGRRDEPLYEEVLRLLESERPEARTLALFAHRDSDGRLHIQRLDPAGRSCPWWIWQAGAWRRATARPMTRRSGSRPTNISGQAFCC